MKSSSILLPLFCLMMWSCHDEAEIPVLPTEFEGPKVAVGNGHAWTFIITNDILEPQTIGIRFNESALQNLPTGSMHADEFQLSMPPELSVPPFNHATLDWNEMGHEPPGVYDIPHFDMHFYFISPSQRDQIAPTDTAAFNKPLEPQHLAPDYLELPGGVPRMGSHIIDLLSPEIAGTGTFTHTFIYGKYNATINFLEPMVSKPFLDSKTTITKPIRWPERWQETGYYPEQYTISYDATTSTYSIALEGLTWQDR